jgi:hypothetical protein
VLSGIFAYYCSIPALAILGLFHPPLLRPALVGLLLKTAADFTVIFCGAHLFRKSGLLRYFIPAAAVHIPLIIGSVLGGVFGKFTWKGHTAGGKINV